MAAGPSRRTFGTLRRLPSGRYQASYVGPDLLRHLAPVTFTAKIDAEGWFRDERRLIEAETWTPPAVRVALKRQAERAPDFATFATGWIERRRTDKGEPLRATTRVGYERMLETYLLPTFGKLRLKDITKEMVRLWYTNPKILSHQSPRAASKAYGLLRAIMNTAVEEDLIAASPVQIRGAGYSPKRRRLEPASLEELNTIVEAMPERLRLMVLLACWCALRYGELAELRRGDIRIVGRGSAAVSGVIRVRRAVVFLTGSKQVSPPKTEAGVRDVAIPPHLIPVVQAHLKSYVGVGSDALLFPAEIGGHLWPSVVERHFRLARAAAGRSDLRFHDLRHTGAVMAAQQGATLADLQARLGHSTANAALLYQHTAKGRDQLIAESLSRMVGEVG